MVIALSDHGNGGMSIGNRGTDKAYSRLRHERVVGPLRKVSLTGEGIEKALKDDRSEDNVRKVIGKYLGIDDLTPGEMAAVRSAKPGKMNEATGPLVSTRSCVGWTTHGHTGEDLFFYYYGWTDLCQRWRTPISPALWQKRWDSTWPMRTGGSSSPPKRFQEDWGIGDPRPQGPPQHGPHRRIGGEESRVAAEQKYHENRGKDENHRTLEGITVLAPATGKVYIPRQAVEIFENVQGFKSSKVQE
jgi:alkaline phosphatase